MVFPLVFDALKRDQATHALWIVWCALWLEATTNQLEVYPQRQRCLRGPLGTDQALLDPVTLAPLGVGSVDEAVAYACERWVR